MIYISLASAIIIVLALMFRSQETSRSWLACDVKAVINDAVVIKCGIRVKRCFVRDDDGKHVLIRCRRESVRDAS